MKPRKNFTVSAAPDWSCQLWIDDEREDPELDEAYAALVNDALKASRKPLRYVATFGHFGLEVNFYDDALAYGRAVKAAKIKHEYDDMTAYLHGDCKP
jgi:hypothetical protein